MRWLPDSVANTSEIVKQSFRNYYINRIFQMVITIFSVITLSFALIRLLPGGPVEAIKARIYTQARESGESVNAEQVNNLVEAYSGIQPDQPLIIQYFDYIFGVLIGDLGVSTQYQTSVTGVILEALPWTLFLFSIATVLMFVLNLILGAMMAYFERGRFDKTLSSFAIISASTPFYIAAVLLIFLFSYNLGYFPTGGKMNTDVTPGFTVPFALGIIHHMVLPLAALVLTAGHISISMRANSISVLGENFVRVARLRGLSPYTVAIRYVGRNAILPMYTGLVVQFGAMFGGSVVLEEIFRYSGIGFVLFQSITNRDYPLMMGCFLLITIMIVMGLFIADLTYSFLDPRIKNKNSESFGSPIRASIVKKIRSLLKSQGTAENGTPKRTSHQNSSNVDSVLNFDTDDNNSATTKERVVKYLDSFVYAPFMVIWADIRGKIATIILFSYLFAGTVGIQIMDPPRAFEHDRMELPFQSLDYPLGTDQNGMGIFAQLVDATPSMLKMIASGAIFATVVAAIIGIVAGYRGGVTDRILMTLSDIAMTIPGLPLVMVLAAILQPESPYVVGVILTINAWGGTARNIRSEVLSVRESPYIEAGRTMGTPLRKTLLRDVLPNVLPYTLIMGTSMARTVIFSSVALYFLGVLPFTTFNWGVMLNNAFGSGAMQSWRVVHWLLMPMLTIIVLSAGLVLLAQAADALTNPRIRAKHARTAKD